MKFTTVALFVLGMIVGAAVAYYLPDYLQINPEPKPTPKVVSPPRGASALGRIQPEGSVISLGISLPDQLAKLFVQEGQEVNQGAKLAELASHGDRQLELNLLDYQIKEASLKLKEIDRSGALQVALDSMQVKQIEAQGRIDIKMQKLKVDFLTKQAAQAQEGLDRIAPLTAVSKQEKDQQELAVLQSQSELAGASGLLEKLTQGTELNLELAKARMDLTRATLDRTRQEVPLDTLKQQREMAAARLAQTFITAPSPGKILKILAHPGELVGAPQPILQMADLSKMVVLAEVYETDIRKVYLGQRADITSKVDDAAS